MPRPTATSAPDILSPCVKAIPDWCTKHEKVLHEELDDQFDGAKEATALGKELDQTQAKVETERKEDKGLTTQRDNDLSSIRRFQKSVTASVQLRLQEHPDKQRILRDFSFGPPSRMRSIPQANKRLREMETSIQVHQDTLRKGGKDRTDFWLKRIDGFQKGLDQLSVDDVRERKETREAYEKRDLAQEKVATFLKKMELVAEAVLDLDEAPFLELQVIFDRWNPSTASGSSTTSSGKVETPSEGTTPSSE